MARNEEKNLARLNRLILQNQKEENLKKNPPRPKLDTLNTADDIKKWLPSIKRDIDFNLKQSQVTCYPERKIKEFTDKVDELHRLYKKFVRKLRELEPQLGSVPWVDRCYESKKRQNPEGHSTAIEEVLCGSSIKKAKADDEAQNKSQTESVKNDETLILQNSCCQETINLDTDKIINKSKFVPIRTPILDKEDKYKSLSGFSKQKNMELHVNTELQNEPLSFDKEFCSKQVNKKEIVSSRSANKVLNTLTLYKDERVSDIKTLDETVSSSGDQTEAWTLDTSLLKLPYSDSDDSS